MNKLKVVMIAVLLFSVSALVALSDITIVYTSGPCKIDRYGNDNWVPARLHLQLEERSVVKTGAGGTIEFDIDGQTVAIGENTTVSINYIMANMTKRKKIGWFKSFTGLFGKKSGGNTALLGVRGAKAEGKDEEMDWIGDESDLEGGTKLDNAISLYSEKKYADAIRILENLLKDTSFTQKRGEASFYLGSCYFEGLQYDRASKYFKSSLKDAEAAPYYEEALLKYAFAEYFQEHYKKAIDGFKSYTDKYKDKEMAPYALLMIGKSYKELGQNDSARKYLDIVRKKYKSSEASVEASKELKR